MDFFVCMHDKRKRVLLKMPCFREKTGRQAPDCSRIGYKKSAVPNLSSVLRMFLWMGIKSSTSAFPRILGWYLAAWAKLHIWPWPRESESAMDDCGGRIGSVAGLLLLGANGFCCYKEVPFIEELQEIILLWESGPFQHKRQALSCPNWPGSSITMMVLRSFLAFCCFVSFFKKIR